MLIAFLYLYFVYDFDNNNNMREMTHAECANTVVNPSIDCCQNESDEKKEKNDSAHDHLLHHQHNVTYIRQSLFFILLLFPAGF